MRIRILATMLTASAALAVWAPVAAAAERIMVLGIIDDRDLSLTTDGLTTTFRAGLRSVKVGDTEIPQPGQLTITCVEGGTHSVWLTVPRLDTVWGLKMEVWGRASIKSFGGPSGGVTAEGLPVIVSPMAGAAFILRVNGHAPDIARAIYDITSIRFKFDLEGSGRSALISLIPSFETREIKNKSARLTQMCRLL